MSSPADQPTDPPPGIIEHGPPWLGGTEITQSQLAALTLKFGLHEYELILESLNTDGAITVIPDP